MAIRLVPMSKQDPDMKGKTILEIQKNFFDGHLKKHAGSFAFKTAINANDGDLFLFQLEGKVIASAELDKKIKKPVKDVNGYTGEYYFKSETVKIFNPISADELRQYCKDFKGFNRSPQYLEVISVSALEKRINSRINDDEELIDYINNHELIIKELGMEELYLRYLNIIKDIYNRSNIVEKLKMIISYYYTFSNESRFIYILKESKFDVIMIMLLIFRMVFNLDDNKIKLINFKYVKKKEQECFNNIQNSIYKDEIIYYLQNKELVLKELKLNKLDEDTKELIKRA